MLLNEKEFFPQHQWQWLVEQYPYLESHAFVMTPNHIHGVLEINGSIIK